MTQRGEFSTAETVVVAVLVLGLLFLAASVARQRRTDAAPGGTAAALRRIDSAKAQYAAERRLPAGTPVTEADLARGGYLRGQLPAPPPGLTYHVGAVGEPAHLEPQ